MTAKRGKQVTFIFQPSAPCRRVYLAGSFNAWSPDRDRMQRTKDGSFRRRIALDPGRYEYRFVADGSWQHDPGAESQVPNAHGELNSVVCVGRM